LASFPRAFKPARTHDPGEVALDQGDGGAFDSDFGAGTHGDADIGRRQRRRVVDAVAGHRDNPAGLAQPGHDGALLIGQHLGFGVSNPELLRHGLRRGSVVTGHHDHLHALSRQCLQRLRRRGLHGIGDGK
jgi:hypothetical protein